MRRPATTSSCRRLLPHRRLLAGAPVAPCRYCGTGSAVDSEFNVVSVDTGGQAAPPGPA
jgi:hypothetical protein